MNILSFIPDSVKNQIVDSLVDFLADQAERWASDEIAGKIRKFSSKAEFQRSVDQALENAARRFVAEYTLEDEDLVAAVTGDETLWQSQDVQKALVELVRRPGGWTTEEQEIVLRHFEGVLPRRVNRERVDRAVSFFLRCVAQELWTLPGAKEIREIYNLQFQKLTAEAAREQVALARQQLGLTAQLSADLRQALLQLTAAFETKLLTAPAPAPVLPRPRPYHNLPQPDYTRFVGRENELAWLRKRLAPDDRAWQIALTGIGGVGKSALALALAHEYRRRYDELPPDERFEALVWISAKEEVLTAQGRESAGLPEFILQTLEDVYTAIARALEREDITRALPQDQSRLVERALQQQRTLLIMDNLESVQDERIKPFLRNLPAPTKAVITSREWLDVADVLTLTGLAWEESEHLLIEEAQVRGVQLDEAQRERLFRLTSGLPLPIKLGVARIAGGESFEAVTRWLGDAVGDLPEYCIQGQFELVRQRDPRAWRVFLACALFDRGAGASREALGRVANLSLADRDSALAQLQRLFLVNRNKDDRFWELPIVQRYAREEFTSTESGWRVVGRWLGWLARFAQANGVNLTQNVERIPALSTEYPNLLSAIRWCREQGRWNILFQLAEGTWDYPYLVGLYNEMEEVLDAAMEAAKSMADDRKQGRVELHLGRLAKLRRQNDGALEHLAKAEKSLQQYDNDVDLGEAWATRVSILLDYQQLEEAEQLGQSMLERGKRLNDVDLKIRAAELLSSIEIKREHFDKATAWLDKAEGWARNINAQRRLAMIFYRRGRDMARQKNYSDAEELFLQAIDLHVSWGEYRLVARSKYRLAEVYVQTGRLPLARKTAEEAQSLYERLGMETRLTLVNELLQQLPKGH